MTESAKHSGSLVVIGGAALISSSASDPLPALPGADANRIVLAEPDPQRGELLARELGRLRQVTVLPMLPAATEGEAELALYNLPGLRCLKPLQPALTALLPGLQLRKRLSAKLVRIETLLEKAGELPGPLALWIDLPGSEGDLLQALQGSDVLERAEHLVLRGCDASFFAGGMNPKALRERMEKLGFALLGTDASDADFPVMRFRADHLARARHLRQTLDTQQAGLQAKLDEQVKQVEEWRRKAALLDEQRQRTEAALEATKRDLGLAIQAQAGLQSDLRDLRARYEASEKARRAQDDLLRQLTPRLHEAARQLSALRLNDAPATLPKPRKAAKLTASRKAGK